MPFGLAQPPVSISGAPTISVLISGCPGLLAPQLRRTSHQSDPARPGYRRRRSRRDPAGGRPIAVPSDQSADATGISESVACGVVG